MPCGAGSTHTLVVRDTANPSCLGGGGYRVGVSVQDARGVELTSPSQVKLGGGPKRKLPAWMDPDKALGSGPLLNDERVP